MSCEAPSFNDKRRANDSSRDGLVGLDGNHPTNDVIAGQNKTSSLLSEFPNVEVCGLPVSILKEEAEMLDRLLGKEIAALFGSN
jgi:hypothetical protein